MRLSLDTFSFFLEKAVTCKVTEWNFNTEISDDLFFDLQSRAWANYGRLKSYIQVIKEKQEMMDSNAAKFFLDVLEKECGYNSSMTFPNVNTWWPQGLNHGLDDIFEKYAS